MNEKDPETRRKFRKLARKFGFKSKETDDEVILIAKMTNGKDVGWIRWGENRIPILGGEPQHLMTILGNTDQCNIWFHETRKDMTPKKLMRFAEELSEVLDLNPPFPLHKIVDPEDWQEIAGIYDAYDDVRYMEDEE